MTSLTLVRDRLAKKRQDLPWVKVGKDYVFQSAEGDVRLDDLFDGRSRLIVYHFMFGADARCGEAFLGIYDWLDIVPKGRNERISGSLGDWMKRHDRCDNDGRTRRSAPATADGSWR